MNKVRDIQKLIQSEHDANIPYGPNSWHWQYRRSPYVYIGNLDLRLSEGDLLVSFSQFGEIVDLKLGRDKNTGDSRGFAWVAYEDPRSTVLAIEEMCGAELLGRTIFVDHASNQKGGQNLTKVSTLSLLSLSNQHLSVPPPPPQGGNNTIGCVGSSGLTGNLINDIDDGHFEADEDLLERRRLIWDYEAFYLDSDDESNCMVLYNRLVDGKYQDDVAANQIDQSQWEPSGGSIHLLEDLERLHNDDEIDQFNTNIPKQPGFISSTSRPTTTATTPSSADSHNSGIPQGQSNVEDLLSGLGYSSDHFGSKNGSVASTSLSILEKLKQERLSRAQKFGGHGASHGRNDGDTTTGESKRGKYNNEDDYDYDGKRKDLKTKPSGRSERDRDHRSHHVENDRDRNSRYRDNNSRERESKKGHDGANKDMYKRDRDRNYQ